MIEFIWKAFWKHGILPWDAVLVYFVADDQFKESVLEDRTAGNDRKTKTGRV